MPQLDVASPSAVQPLPARQRDEQLVDGPTRQELQERYQQFIADVKTNMVVFYGRKGRIMVRKLGEPAVRVSNL